MYFKNLDFVRFLAIALVILEHWFATPVSDFFMTGRLGVSLFFTLSGFLITGILLSKKEEIDAGKTSTKKALKIFYIRRSLRIFPIYYLILIFLYLVKNQELIDHKYWYIFYGSNILTYIQQHWDGLLGPFWSLAVEEQFYLLWPFLIFFISKKHILKTLYAFIGLAIISRVISIWAAEQFLQPVDYYVSMVALTPSCFDCFAIGGLLAYYNLYKDESNRLSKLINSKVFAVVSFIGAAVFLYFKQTYLFYLFFPTVFSLASLYVIKYFISDKKSILRNIAGFKPFIYFGKISYGIYVYHSFLFIIVSFCTLTVARFNLSSSFEAWLDNSQGVFRAFLMITYLLIICTVSYFLVEKPMMRLKEKFR
ncbi:acyltransferase family protein [Ferruginibacter sp. SUN002]|uniref:acyltransferase family protein n=1 Tax=Ferruginibacter sp. SUN002 TaxID=2937789 RepID=UPI003D36E7FE